MTLMKEDAPQRAYPLRELFNALRHVIRCGIAWRAMPNDLPPWHAVHQQAHRWLTAGCFEALAHDLHALLRLAAGRTEEPTVAIIDSRTLRSTPKAAPAPAMTGPSASAGPRFTWLSTRWDMLALHVTSADVGDRQAVTRLAADIQDATGDTVTLAYVDQGYTGEATAAAAAEGITLEVVKPPEAKRGFVLLLRLFVAIDRTSKFAFARLVERAGKMEVADVLCDLVRAVPYAIHTVLTDNGIQFTNRARHVYDSQHIFDRVCDEHGIEHRLTKVNRSWTNGQVERMNRTLKDATVKRFHYNNHDELRAHFQLFLDAYNHARRLKALRGLTPYEFIH